LTSKTHERDKALLTTYPGIIGNLAEDKNVDRPESFQGYQGGTQNLEGFVGDSPIAG
jgi:hypothetical protein